VIGFLLDEDQRGDLWWHVQGHNLSGEHPIDCVCVGDVSELQLESSDPEILLWAEEAGRILVTRDRRTMGTHLRAHLDSGHHSPGVFIVRPGKAYADVLDFLVCTAYASDGADWTDRIEYIP
jgi:hypothetical protein